MLFAEWLSFLLPNGAELLRIGALLLFQIGVSDIANQGSPQIYISGQNYYKSRQLKIWADLLEIKDAIRGRGNHYSLDLTNISL